MRIVGSLLMDIYIQFYPPTDMICLYTYLHT